MTDLHCHILPGLDDGSESPAMSAEMARIAAARGTDHIACTPHCQSDDPDLPARILRIRRLTEALGGLLRREAVPVTLYPGMELLCRGGLPGLLEAGGVLPLADSRYLLIEFDFDAPLAHMERSAARVLDAGLRPIIAHPERYDAVQREPQQLRRWFRSGVLLQLNKASILGRFGPRPEETADFLLREGLAHVVASDAHRPDVRTPDLSAALRAVALRCSPAYAKLLFSENPARILRDRDIVRPDEF